MNLLDLDFELRGMVENLLFKLDEEYPVTEKQIGNQTPENDSSKNPLNRITIKTVGIVATAINNDCFENG